MRDLTQMDCQNHKRRNSYCMESQGGITVMGVSSLWQKDKEGMVY